MQLVSLSSTRPFLRYHSRYFTHSVTTKIDYWWWQSKEYTQKWLDNDHEQRQTTASNQQSTTFYSFFRPCETRICKFHCHRCSARWDIVRESLHVNYTQLTKLTVYFTQFHGQHKSCFRTQCWLASCTTEKSGETDWSVISNCLQTKIEWQ